MTKNKMLNKIQIGEKVKTPIKYSGSKKWKHGHGMIIPCLQIKSIPKTITITIAQLEEICGSAFDRGYYKGIYQGNTLDNSVDIFVDWKNNDLKEKLKAIKINPKKK